MAVCALLSLGGAAGQARASWLDELPEVMLPSLDEGIHGPEESALERRMWHERRAGETRFSILPHKPNYLLPVTWNSSPNHLAYADMTNGEEINELEVKFQISIKTPFWEDILGSGVTLYGAYSQLALWQAYSGSASTPFREINFEPELFLTIQTGGEVLGVTSQAVTLGLTHQSNGRSEPLSRSWNRIVASFLFSRGNTYVTVTPWWRIPESGSDDDNPRMEKYYGYGELAILQKLGDHTLSVLLRNNLRDDGNKGAVQVGWSFPLNGRLKGYVQYFNGYGESLVDYNHATNRIGIGVMLNDWL